MPQQDSENRKNEAEIFQHVSEAKESMQQTLDTATEEQAAVQQKDIPKVEEQEDVAESSTDLPMEEEINIDKENINTEKQTAEKIESENKERKNKNTEHPTGWFSSIISSSFLLIYILQVMYWMKWKHALLKVTLFKPTPCPEEMKLFIILIMSNYWNNPQGYW